VSEGLVATANLIGMAVGDIAWGTIAGRTHEGVQPYPATTPATPPDRSPSSARYRLGGETLCRAVADLASPGPGPGRDQLGGPGRRLTEV
jgi:hypothetical protein